MKLSLIIYCTLFNKSKREATLIRQIRVPGDKKKYFKGGKSAHAPDEREARSRVRGRLSSVFHSVYRHYLHGSGSFWARVVWRIDDDRQRTRHVAATPKSKFWSVIGARCNGSHGSVHKQGTCFEPSVRTIRRERQSGRCVAIKFDNADCTRVRVDFQLWIYFCGKIVNDSPGALRCVQIVHAAD